MYLAGCGLVRACALVLGHLLDAARLEYDTSRLFDVNKTDLEAVPENLANAAKCACRLGKQTLVITESAAQKLLELTVLYRVFFGFC